MNSRPQNTQLLLWTPDDRFIPIGPIPGENVVYYTDEDFNVPSRATGLYYYQNNNEEDNLPEIATEEEFHRFLFEFTNREDENSEDDHSQYTEVIKKYAHWIPPVGRIASSSITLDDAEDSLDDLTRRAVRAIMDADRPESKETPCCGMHQEPKFDEE
ncbi:hypothetical protein BZA77DRAFT_349710 [Pyronema omphalodes]|nr:hypothetical protein BZA77DRAFT_349710 [Pyronema omphalodes]